MVNIRLTESQMMTHVFQNKEGKHIIAAKGGLKPSLRFPTSTPAETKIYGTIDTLASKDTHPRRMLYRIQGTNTQNQEISLSFLWDWWFSMTRQSQYSTCNPAVL
jgi:Ca2+-transporting ATPase